MTIKLIGIALALGGTGIAAIGGFGLGTSDIIGYAVALIGVFVIAKG